MMVGRNKFFFPSDVQLPLTGGLEAWRGFYSSVRPAHKQLMVNVNAVSTYPIISQSDRSKDIHC